MPRAPLGLALVALLCLAVPAWTQNVSVDPHLDPSLAPAGCAACHAGQLAEDKVTPWSQTSHATFFTEAIDGQKSAFYNESCIQCHVLGYDTSEEADNGGFDDLADGFWTFPETLEEGNWDDMVNNYPGLANLANILCEHCHGPGSDHFG